MDEWSQSCDDKSWSYDAAGNLLSDGMHTYTYDAENRILTPRTKTCPRGPRFATIDGAAAYIYDAEGRRVAKVGSGGAVTASYVLGLGGEQVSEVNGGGAWAHSNVFVGGRLMATYEGPGGTAHLGYHFHLTDWLGTQRMQTSVNGNEEERCYSYPFGDGLNCTGADATEHHFTGKERDAESGLDYFGARYLSSNLGRFMTPDWAAAPTGVPYASFGDPQSLNLYAYAGNNPNIWIDLDGHDGVYPGGGAPYSNSQQWGNQFANYGTASSGSNQQLWAGGYEEAAQMGIMSQLSIGDTATFQSNSTKLNHTIASTNAYDTSGNLIFSTPGTPRDFNDIGIGTIFFMNWHAPASLSAPNNGECDNACQLAHAFNKTGVYSLTSVCFVPGFYAASAAGATGAVAVANAPEVYAATAGDYASWYGRAVSWLSRMVGKTPTGAGTAIAAAPGALSQFCSSH